MNVTLKDGRTLDVEYRITSYGPPTTYSPRTGADGGDGPEIEVTSIATLDGQPVTLTADELEEVELYILEHDDFDPSSDDDW